MISLTLYVYHLLMIVSSFQNMWFQFRDHFDEETMKAIIFGISILLLLKLILCKQYKWVAGIFLKVDCILQAHHHHFTTPEIIRLLSFFKNILSVYSKVYFYFKNEYNCIREEKMCIFNENSIYYHFKYVVITEGTILMKSAFPVQLQLQYHH